MRVLAKICAVSFAISVFASCGEAHDSVPRQNHIRCSYVSGFVHVYGEITTDIIFGPPNYGENPDTDSKQTSVTIKLNALCSSKIGLRSSMRALQISGLSTIELRKFSGKRVEVYGNVSAAESGHDHTKYVIYVNKYKVL